MAGTEPMDKFLIIITINGSSYDEKLASILPSAPKIFKKLFLSRKLPACICSNRLSVQKQKWMEIVQWDLRNRDGNTWIEWNGNNPNISGTANMTELDI